MATQTHAAGPGWNGNGSVRRHPVWTRFAFRCARASYWALTPGADAEMLGPARLPVSCVSVPAQAENSLQDPICAGGSPGASAAGRCP